MVTWNETNKSTTSQHDSSQLKVNNKNIIIDIYTSLKSAQR